MGGLHGIVFKQPFDIADEFFRKDLYRPEKLSSEIKFYTLLGTFALTELELEKVTKKPDFAGILGALSGGIPSRDVIYHYQDTLCSGVKMATEIGLPPPTGRDRFYQTADGMDRAAIHWGAKLYHAITHDDVAPQVWAVDRKISNLETRTHATFCGDYDHRVRHGDAVTSCTTEHDNATILQHHAAFHLKLATIARNRMRETFWDRGEVTEDLEKTWRMMFEDIKSEHLEEKERVEDLMDELSNKFQSKSLSRQILAVYQELGDMTGRVFL